MAASSKHKYDVARWIKDVIKSCDSPIQIVSAGKLIDNYSKIYIVHHSVITDLLLIANDKAKELEN